MATESWNPKVDAYVAKAQPFAQPILFHLRELVHKACPGVEETIKWSRPFFEYRGAILGNMSAFKAKRLAPCCAKREPCAIAAWARWAASPR